MKKYNLLYILLLVLIGFIIAFLCAYFIFLPGWRANRVPSSRIISLAFTVIILFGSILCILSLTLVKQIIWKIFVKKHEQVLEDQNFNANSKFTSSNIKLYVDIKHGKIGFISAFNPFTFQEMNANSITETWIDDGTSKALFGGTRLVRFCFLLDGKTYKIPTLTSRNTKSMKSSWVIDALEKAQTQVDYLEEARKNAR